MIFVVNVAPPKENKSFHTQTNKINMHTDTWYYRFRLTCTSTIIFRNSEHNIILIENRLNSVVNKELDIDAYIKSHISKISNLT